LRKKTWGSSKIAWKKKYYFVHKVKIYRNKGGGEKSSPNFQTENMKKQRSEKDPKYMMVK